MNTFAADVAALMFIVGVACLVLGLAGGIVWTGRRLKRCGQDLIARQESRRMAIKPRPWDAQGE